MPRGIKSTEPKKLKFNAFIKASVESTDKVLAAFAHKYEYNRKGRVTLASLQARDIEHAAHAWNAFVAAGGK